MTQLQLYILILIASLASSVNGDAPLSTCVNAVIDCQKSCRYFATTPSENSCNSFTTKCRCQRTDAVTSGLRDDEFCGAQNASCANTCGDRKVEGVQCDRQSGIHICQCAKEMTWDVISSLWEDRDRCMKNLETCYSTTCKDKTDVRSLCVGSVNVCDCSSNPSSVFPDYTPPKSNSKTSSSSRFTNDKFGSILPLLLIVLLL